MEKKIKKKKKSTGLANEEEKYLNGMYADGGSIVSTRSHKERQSERGAERREARDLRTPLS